MSGSGSHSAGGSSSHAGPGPGSHSTGGSSSHAGSGLGSHLAGGSVSYLVAETDFFAAFFFLFFFMVFLKDITPFLALLRGGTEPSVIEKENVGSHTLSIAN